MTQMKKIKSVFIFGIAMMMLTACNVKEEIVEALSQGEAAEIIESALQEAAGGLTTNIQDIAAQLATAVTSGELCDTLYSDSIEKGHQGVQLQGSYTTLYTYEMTCNELDIPQTASFSSTTTAIYSSARIDSNDEGSFIGNVFGLQPSSSSLNLEGKYNSTGTQELAVQDQKNVKSVFAADLSGLSINKESNNIESGTATFSLLVLFKEKNFPMMVPSFLTEMERPLSL